MFIQTETTPNPATLKFLPGKEVLGEATAFFTNKEEASRSPLVAALFELPEIKAVFLGSDFVTITKADEASWGVVKPLALTTIMEHYVSGNPMLVEEARVSSATRKTDYSEEEQKVVDQIIELIDTRVRPAVAMDGGDIIFHGFEQGIVRLEMHGACSGCPSSTVTLKQGIEGMLKHYVPEVMAVEAVEAA